MDLPPGAVDSGRDTPLHLRIDPDAGIVVAQGLHFRLALLVRVRFMVGNLLPPVALMHEHMRNVGDVSGLLAQAQHLVVGQAVREFPLL